MSFLKLCFFLCDISILSIILLYLALLIAFYCFTKNILYVFFVIFGTIIIIIIFYFIKILKYKCYKKLNIVFPIDYDIENNIYGATKKNSDNLTDCIICLEEIKKDQIIPKLSCDHKFHKECINSWINVNSSCPICREIVVPFQESCSYMISSVYET